MADAQFVTGQQTAASSTNKVLRSTYMLLSMTLVFSAMMAGVAMAINAPYMGWIPLIVAFGLLFAINKMRNSAWSMANPELSYADRRRNSGGPHGTRTDRNDFLFLVWLRPDNEERFLIHVRLPDDRHVGRHWQHRSVVRGQHDGLGNIRIAPCHFSGDCHSHVRFYSV